MGLRIAHKAHQRAAVRFERNGRWLGAATVIASTVVGTSLFADASSTLSTGWKIGAGILSLVAAVLSAVQGTLRFSELATLHRAAAQHYGPLRREVEELLAELGADATPTPEKIADVRKRWDEVDADSPSVPQKLYDAVVASLQRHPPSGKAV
jgi:hypothetical protein